MNFIPDFHVEPEVDMEVLMVIVVEDAIWLPWLPPVGLEVDAGMVDDAMVVQVSQDRHENSPVNGEENHRAHEYCLHMDELERVNGCDAKSSGLLVLVVKLVEILVEEGQVVEPVVPVGEIILPHEDDRPGGEVP